MSCRSSIVQEVAKDIAVIESQHTEDVRDYIERHQKQSEVVAFVNSETACMACTLKQAVSFEAEHGLQKHGRWIIHKVKDPVSTRPKLRLAIRSSQRRAMITENPTAGNAEKGGVAMDIDEDL
jgi:hypothetical protein